MKDCPYCAESYDTEALQFHVLREHGDLVEALWAREHGYDPGPVGQQRLGPATYRDMRCMRRPADGAEVGQH